MQLILLPLVIILLGPPGSGKGTQAVKLAEEMHIPHISTGDLFRENISKNTELGQKAKEYMNAGQLVPDELVLDMLFDRVKAPDCKDGYLLDGFLRTIPQANALDEALKGKARVAVLNLEVPDSEIVKRITGRLSCPACGAIYHTAFSPPKIDNQCDRCDTGLAQRKDDTEEVVKQRLNVYKKQTEPLIEHYQSQGVLKSFDGNRAPEVVYQDLVKYIQSLGPKSE